MIRGVVKYFAFLYVLLIVLIAIFAIAHGRLNSESVWILAWAAGGAIVLIFVGLFLGMVLSVLFKKPSKERLFYFLGQSVMLLILAWLVIDSDFKHRPQLSNAEENEKKIGYLDNQTPGDPAIKIAYQALAAKFKNPNDFLFLTYNVFEHDSIVDSKTDSVYVIYLSYNTGSDMARELFAKFRVFQGQAEMKLFNIDTRENEEWARAAKEWGKAMDTVRKYYPDAGR